MLKFCLACWRNRHNFKGVGFAGVRMGVSGLLQVGVAGVGGTRERPLISDMILDKCAISLEPPAGGFWIDVDTVRERFRTAHRLTGSNT